MYILHTSFYHFSGTIFVSKQKVLVSVVPEISLVCRNIRYL